MCRFAVFINGNKSLIQRINSLPGVSVEDGNEPINSHIKRITIKVDREFPECTDCMKAMILNFEGVRDIRDMDDMDNVDDVDNIDEWSRQ